MPALKIDLSTGLPGEQAFVALLYYLGVLRQTMSPENRDEADRIGLAMLKGWHKLLGWPGLARTTAINSGDLK